MTIPEAVVSVLAGLGGGGVAIAILIKAISGTVGRAVEQHLRHTQDKTLELLRGELGHRNQLLASALSFRNTESMAAQERRLKAVDTLWTEVMRVRRVTAPALYPYSILVESEYPKAFNIPGLAANIPRFEVLLADAVPASDTAEAVRPFLGERLWFAFVMYRAVSVRIAFRVADAKEHGKSLPHWHKDEDGKADPVIDLARPWVTEEQIRAAIKAPFHGVRGLLDFMEQKILMEMENRVSGKATADLTLAEGLRLAEAMATAQSEQLKK
jgi:hypothetical protein